MLAAAGGQRARRPARRRRRGAGAEAALYRAARRRPAVAHAPADRRAHEALAQRRRPDHLDRGRLGPVEAAPRASSASRPCRSWPGGDAPLARVPGAQRLAGRRCATAAAGEVNLGIAVSLGDEGLIVPVVRGAQRLGWRSSAARIAELAARARPGALPRRRPRRDLHDHQPRPVRHLHGDPGDQPAPGRDPRHRVDRPPPGRRDGRRRRADRDPPGRVLGLSWDHRALDGVVAAQFLGALRERLQSASRARSGGAPARRPPASVSAEGGGAPRSARPQYS